MADFIDIERQVHRELEGQDTITPLTNTAFLKQFNKLKQHGGSNKSINSTNSQNRYSTISDHTDMSADTQSIQSSSSQKNKFKMPQSFKTLFRGQSSRSNMDQNFMDLLEQNANFDNDNQTATLNRSLLYQSSRNEEVFSNYKSLHCGPSSTTNMNSAKTSFLNLNSNKTDKVFDALSSIISQQNNIILNDKANNKINSIENTEKFIENVRLIVKQSELIKKHKINKSIFVCRLFTFLVFLFIAIFVLYFVKTILAITSQFLRVDNYNSYYDLNRTTLNSTTLNSTTSNRTTFFIHSNKNSTFFFRKND
jgi:hypothetical protein